MLFSSILRKVEVIASNKSTSIQLIKKGENKNCHGCGDRQEECPSFLKVDTVMNILATAKRLTPSFVSKAAYLYLFSRVCQNLGLILMWNYICDKDARFLQVTFNRETHIDSLGKLRSRIDYDALN
jgi:hypothetical protein